MCEDENVFIRTRRHKYEEVRVCVQVLRGG